MGNSAVLKSILCLEYIMSACEGIKSHQFKTNVLVVQGQFREAPSLLHSVWVVVV
jgi:hypothetical protein